MKKILASGAVMAVLAGLSACATTASDRGELSEDAKARLAEFKKTGETRSCMNLTRIDQITPLSERHFLVRVGLNDYYLTETRNRCGGADRNTTRLQYRVTNNQLCQNEIIRVVDNTTGITQGSCGWGKYQRLEKKLEDDDNS